MYHLFLHNGKYDFAFIKSNQYIAGSNQGYEKKNAALKSMFHCGGGVDTEIVHYQDDTTEVPTVRAVYFIPNTKKITTDSTGLKAKKKYIPNKK